MARISDTNYLRSEQYHNSSNLEARIALHTRFSVNRHSWQRWVFDQISFPADGRLLELGCGPGTLWQENLDRLPSGLEITLSDFSTGMVSQAQKNLAKRMGTARFQTIDAQAIPYPEASFECSNGDESKEGRVAISDWASHTLLLAQGNEKFPQEGKKEGGTSG